MDDLEKDFIELLDKYVDALIEIDCLTQLITKNNNEKDLNCYMLMNSHNIGLEKEIMEIILQQFRKEQA